MSIPRPERVDKEIFIQASKTNLIKTSTDQVQASHDGPIRSENGIGAKTFNKSIE